MRKDHTELVCIIDRSGSMESIRSDAVGGFNAFLEDQRSIRGILIEKNAAKTYLEKVSQSAVQKVVPDSPSTQGTPVRTATAPGSTQTGIPDQQSQQPVSQKKSHFYGTVKLDPLTAKLDFANIVDEVIQQFTSQLAVNVDISVEISAQKESGFDESVQRAVRENCNVLKFRNAEFEEG